MVISLLANQDLTPMLQHYWWESFDGDSFASQSRFDAYAACMHIFYGKTIFCLSLDFHNLSRNWA